MAISIALLAGCASSMMLKTETIIEPGPDHAVVNFLRPSMFGGAIKFGLWDSENLIGILTPGNYIQYRAHPGEHFFMARSENWAVVKANLDAGKTYNIVCSPRMGLMKARVVMEVIKPDDPKLDGWLESLTPITFDPAQKEAYVAERIDSVKEAVQNVADGNAGFVSMNAADGR